MKRGGGRNRTDVWGFCRARPYHLATPPRENLPIHVDRRGDNGNLACASQGAFRLVQRIHDAVAKGHLQPAYRNLDVNCIGIVAAALNDYGLRFFGVRDINNSLPIGWSVGGLRNESDI